MGEELKALEASGICELIKRPEQVNALHTKWMFKTKTDANGNIERFKARQVGCGNKHVLCGVDCGLTFTAVMDISTVKVIMAHVVMCKARIKASNPSMEPAVTNEAYKGWVRTVSRGHIFFILRIAYFFLRRIIICHSSSSITTSC